MEEYAQQLGHSAGPAEDEYARQLNWYAPRDPTGEVYWTPEQGQTTTDRVAGALAGLPVSFAQSLINAAATPGDVYMHGMTQDEMIQRSADLADMLAMGGAGWAAAGPALGGVGIFGGKLAKTADHAALAKAERMAAQGADRGTIWNDTGWFQGKDGKWRFEIPDDASASLPISRASEMDYRAGSAGTDAVEDVFRHPHLGEAYPGTTAGFDDAGTRLVVHTVPEMYPGGAYYAGEHRIKVGGEPGRGSNVAPDRSTLLHELQHDIQTREGFARGGSVSEYARGPMFDKRANELQGALSKEITGGLSSRPEELAEIIKYGDPERLRQIVADHGFSSLDDAMEFLKHQSELRTPFSQYRRTAGEVEARNVQTRMDMTPEERRARPPWETQDVPDAEQIVRFGGTVEAGLEGEVY